MAAAANGGGGGGGGGSTDVRIDHPQVNSSAAASASLLQSTGSRGGGDADASHSDSPHASLLGNGHAHGGGSHSGHGGSGAAHPVRKCVVCDGRGHIAVAALVAGDLHSPHAGAGAADAAATKADGGVDGSGGDGVVDMKHNLKTYAITLAMAAFYTVMNCFAWVIQHHPDLTNDQYKVAANFLLQSMVAQCAISFVYTARRGKPVLALWARLVPIRISGIVGLCGAVTAVCSMVAGPFLPAAVQTIFYQAQTIIIYLINTQVFLNPVKWYHHVIVGSIVTFNLATAWDGGFATTLSPGMVVVWSVIFIFNSVGTGLSNNLLEAFFSACHVNALDPEDRRLRGGYNMLDFVFAMNGVLCLWSLVALIPLFSVAALAYGDDTIRQVFLDWSALRSNGQWYVFGMGACAWAYSLIGSWVITQTNALWMTVASSIAVLAQLAFFNSSVAGTTYQSPLTTSMWINNVLLCVISTVYSVGQPNKIHNVDNGIFRMYKRALDVSFPPADDADRPQPPLDDDDAAAVAAAADGRSADSAIAKRPTKAVAGNNDPRQPLVSVISSNN